MARFRTLKGFRADPRFGWAGPSEASRAWDEIGHLFPQFKITGTRGKRAPGDRMMLWELVRKVLKKDTPNYPQEVGSCVAFGAKNAIEYIACVEIFRGETEEFHQVFTPYLYGCGRVFVGRGQLRGDGSVGSWQAKAVEQFGTIRKDDPDVPAYNGKLERQWGNPPGPPQTFVAKGKQNLIKTTSRINSWDELKRAIINGYAVTIASDQGFEMQARKDGFHAPSGAWSHQMCIVGVDNEPEDYACVLNSWGDVHGRLTDFHTQEKWPIGSIRARRAPIERMIRSGEAIAYSQFQGFPAQDLDFKKIF